MVSQRARELVTFARTLERALVAMNHEVYRGPDEPDSADLIIGGVTSALSPGATYALVGLETIGRALLEETPLLLFVDDPDLNKTRAAAQSALRELDRLYSPYLMSKRVKQSRNLTKKQRTHITAALTVLSEEVWPPVLMPLHPWASPAIAAKRISIVSEVVPVDVSSAIELPELVYPPQPAMLWLTDRHYSPEQLDPDRVNWPVIPIDSTTMANPAKVYSVARGVHQGAIERMPGWWTPTPLYVAHARTVYLCGTDEGRAMGVTSPYYLTPDDVEWLGDLVHHDLAAAQAAHLKETMWNSDTLSSVLADSLGRVHSSRKRATRTATLPT
jgi:hypothetical protein